MAARVEVWMAGYPEMLERWCCEYAQTMDSSLLPVVHVQVGECLSQERPVQEYLGENAPLGGIDPE